MVLTTCEVKLCWKQVFAKLITWIYSAIQALFFKLCVMLRNANQGIINESIRTQLWDKIQFLFVWHFFLSYVSFYTFSDKSIQISIELNKLCLKV